MAESGPLYLPMLTIMAFVVVLGAALLVLIWLMGTRTPNRFLRTAAPVAVMILGIIWLKDTDAGNIVAASVLFVAPMAALIPPFLFPGFTGPETGINRIVACDLVVSLFGVGLTFFFVLSGLSMIPWIYWHTPVTNGVVYSVVIALYVFLAAGVYAAMKRAGFLMEG
jgi:hypothetical protein